MLHPIKKDGKLKLKATSELQRLLALKVMQYKYVSNTQKLTKEKCLFIISKVKFESETLTETIRFLQMDKITEGRLLPSFFF